MTTTSWLGVAPGEWSLDDLPYCVFSTGGNRHLGVGVGHWIFDLHLASTVGLFRDVVDPNVLAGGSLNPLLNLGVETWIEVRSRTVELLSDPDLRARVEPLLVTNDVGRFHLPWEVADFVDFYSSREHATNVGRLFRPDQEPLLDNWLHIPVGYHGRSGTVVVSGTEVWRPHGVIATGDGPTFGPSRKLDFEIELGFVLGNPTTSGTIVSASDAPAHIFGVVVMNDWSARDIQSFEYQPLGPFLGKSFATSVSAWVLPMVALESSRIPAPEQSPAPHHHLAGPPGWALDITLTASVQRTPAESLTLASTNASTLYWTAPQQIAHLTSNGSPIRAGDLIGTGTISGSDGSSLGSLLEMTADGFEPIRVGDHTLGYLEDGDAVVISAVANRSDGSGVPLGTVRGSII